MANEAIAEHFSTGIFVERNCPGYQQLVRLPLSNGSAIPCAESIKVKRVHHPCEGNIPWISHTDFWPKCLSREEKACDALFETFDILVNRADTWLSQCSKYDLINCETVDKKVHWVRDVYDSSLSFSDDEEHDLVTHIKGLRLWYRKSPDPTLTASLSKFQYRDYIPRYLNPGEKYPVFETLPQVIDRINQQFLEKPLNGFKDFIPYVLDEGGIFHPAKYSSYTSLLQKCTNWINQSDDITVLNIQSIDTKHRKKSESCGKRFKTDDLFEYAIACRNRAFFIRVTYKQELEPEEYHSYPNPRLGIFRSPRLICKTYIPIKRCFGYENKDQVMERAENELRALHANIYHVETVSMPEWLTNPAITERGERTFYDGEWYFLPDNDGNELGPYRYSLVYIIRVYFDCPPLHKALQRRLSMYSVHNNCCVIL